MRNFINMARLEMDEEQRKMGLKSGQVTIFIIVAIMIVVAILGLIFLMGGDGEVLKPADLGPRDFVVSCVRDVVENSIDKMMRNGGEALATQAILYEGEEYTYLCYQADFYQGCYNTHPMLEMQVEREIEVDTSVEVQGCFNAMRADLEDRGFDVTEGVTEYSVDLLPGYVAVDLKKSVDVSGETGAQSFDDFGFERVTPIYDLIRVARQIVNGESQFCHFEYNGYMLLYPKYDIRRIDYQDSKIYRVIDRRTGDEFRFAVRSCAYAPGI
jgi:hypothetical protein